MTMSELLNFFIIVAGFKLACLFNTDLYLSTLLANCSLHARLLNSPKVKRKKAGGIYVFSLEARRISNTHYTRRKVRMHQRA